MPHRSSSFIIHTIYTSHPINSRQQFGTWSRPSYDAIVRSVISRNHPLRQLFTDLVGRELGADREMAVYVADLLVDFTHIDRLYRIRNSRGKRLEEVGEMLIESNPLLEGRSFVREREVRKHIGDFTLFLTGMFPEYVATLPHRGLRLDSVIDYVKAGKESYRVVAAFDQFEYRHFAPLFRRLAEQFEYYVYGLNQVKNRLAALRQQQYKAWRRELLCER
jgi:hypothetical protein